MADVLENAEADLTPMMRNLINTLWMVKIHTCLARKRRLRLGSAARSTFPHHDDEQAFHEGLHRATRTKEQSQRRVCSLVLRMVITDQAT